MIVKVTRVGLHEDHQGGVHLIFIDDPDLVDPRQPQPSISIWFDPDTLRLKRFHRNAKACTSKLKAAERRMWQDVVYRIVAQAKLTEIQKFEVDIDL